MKKEEKKYIYLILFLSLLIIGLTLYAYWKNDFLNFNYFLGTDKLGHFGDFIGGFLGTILTGIATYLVYKTFKSQKKSIKIQEEQLKNQKEELEKQKEELVLNRQLIAQQQFETTFFNMLNVHRELKSGLILNKSIPIFIRFSNNINDVNGVEVFKIICKDYLYFYNKMISKNINELKNYKIIGDFIDKAIESDSDFIDNINVDQSYLNFKPKTHKKKIEFTYRILFKNYQNELSHYCRNVYHILKYVRENEKNKVLGEDKKTYKRYANILQSQLNVDEHIILFYNFICFSENDEDNNIFFPINLVNHYDFLENIGIDNLIFKKHEEFYSFLIKGSDRIIEN